MQQSCGGGTFSVLQTVVVIRAGLCERRAFHVVVLS